MLAAYFGQITRGELRRGPFFAFFSVLLVVFAASCIVLGLSFGLKNVLPVFLPLAAVVLFARLNLAAKRWRNMGAPGWIASLCVAVAVALVLWFAPRGIALLAVLCVFVIEITWPTRTARG